MVLYETPFLLPGLIGPPHSVAIVRLAYDPIMPAMWLAHSVSLSYAGLTKNE